MSNRAFDTCLFVVSALAVLIVIAAIVVGYGEEIDRSRLRDAQLKAAQVIINGQHVCTCPCMKIETPKKGSE